METLDFLTLGHIGVGALVALAACRVWYSRKLKAATARIHKLHAERETLQEQVKHARAQIGQLQHEMAERVKADSNAMRQRQLSVAEKKARAEATAEVAARLKAQVEIPAGAVFEASQLGAHGFADTQPFEDK